MKKRNILLIEDNAGDIVLTREALEEAGFEGKIDVMNDGVKALDYLFQKNKPAFHFPDLILLDINIPRANGLEVLGKIKGRTETKNIPVIILSTSSFQADKNTAYALHANSYIIKPPDVADYFDIIISIIQYWFKAVSLPSEKAICK